MWIFALNDESVYHAWGLQMGVFQVATTLLVNDEDTTVLLHFLSVKTFCFNNSDRKDIVTY